MSIDLGVGRAGGFLTSACAILIIAVNALACSIAELLKLPTVFDAVAAFLRPEKSRNTQALSSIQILILFACGDASVFEPCSARRAAGHADLNTASLIVWQADTLVAIPLLVLPAPWHALSVYDFVIWAAKGHTLVILLL